MIIKIIKALPHASRTKGLAEYITSELGDARAVGIEGLADYTVAGSSMALESGSLLECFEKNVRVISWWTDNLQNAVDIDLAVETMRVTQRQNERAKSDLNKHIVISFADGDEHKLDMGRLKEIEKTVVASIGLSDHQRIVSVHGDTNNLHMHIQVNRVHPDTRCVERGSHEQRRLQEIIPLIERKYKLAITQSVQNPKPSKAVLYEANSAVQSFCGFCQERLSASFLQAQSWEDVHAVVAQEGLIMKRRGAGLVVMEGSGNKPLWTKLSSINRAFSYKNLVERLGGYRAAENVQGIEQLESRYANYVEEKNQAFLNAFRAERLHIQQETNAVVKKIKKEYEKALQELQAKKRAVAPGKPSNPYAYADKQRALFALNELRKELVEVKSEEIKRVRQIQRVFNFKIWANRNHDKTPLMESVLALSQGRLPTKNFMRMADRYVGRPRNVDISIGVFGIKYRTRDGGMLVENRSGVWFEKITKGSAEAFVQLSLRKKCGVYRSESFDRKTVGMLIEASTRLHVHRRIAFSSKEDNERLKEAIAGYTRGRLTTNLGKDIFAGREVIEESAFDFRKTYSVEKVYKMYDQRFVLIRDATGQKIVHTNETGLRRLYDHTQEVSR